jgi:hypothetical protein
LGGEDHDGRPALKIAVNEKVRERSLMMSDGQRIYHVNKKGAVRAIAFHFGLAAAILLICVFVSTGSQAMLDVSKTARVLLWIVAVGGPIVFSTLGFVFLFRLRSDRPLLVLGPDGILDNGSGVWFGVGLIAWSEISDIRLSRYQGLVCVEVVLRDREAFLSRLGPLDRLNRSARLGYPAVAFRGPLLPVPVEQLLEQMRQYWKRYRPDKTTRNV